jgi:hypothetical protein
VAGDVNGSCNFNGLDSAKPEVYYFFFFSFFGFFLSFLGRSFDLPISKLLSNSIQRPPPDNHLYIYYIKNVPAGKLFRTPLIISGYIFIGRAKLIAKSNSN